MSATTKRRAKSLERELAVLITLLRQPGTLRNGHDVEQLCELADEARAYLTLVAAAPLRTGDSK